MVDLEILQQGDLLCYEPIDSSYKSLHVFLGVIKGNLCMLRVWNSAGFDVNVLVHVPLSGNLRLIARFDDAM